MEEVLALQAAAEAVEGLAGLPDPEPHRVHRLSQTRHLPGRRRRRPKTRAAEAKRCECARTLGDLKRRRGAGAREGDGEERRLGTGPAVLGFARWSENFILLPPWQRVNSEMCDVETRRGIVVFFN